MKLRKQPKLDPSSPPSVMSYYRYTSISDFGSSRRLRGPYRVLLFCAMTILTPVMLLITPLYIRYHVYGEATYFVGESDMVTIDRQISTFWCEGQDLWMNATFHAYLLTDQPENSEDLQKVELDKHIQLADDGLEYWGFYLLAGSKVTLSVCSRFGGARLMVVKGTRNLKRCALIEPQTDTDEPWDDVSAQKGEKIEVTFEGGEQVAVEKVPGHIDRTTAVTTTTTRTTTATTTTTTSTTTTTTPRSALVEATTMNATAKQKQQYRLRGRKQPSSTSAPTPFVPDDGFLPEEEIHENRKVVRRHKRTHAIRRHRRADPSDGDSMPTLHTGEDYELDEHEVDEPPPPVGNEPDDNTIHNRMEKVQLGHRRRVHDDDENDEVIDESDIKSSGASFAKNLWTCYGEDTVFTQTFSPSMRCQSQDALLKHALRMRTVHEIASSGYYYYIFYSDNDIVLNDIFAKFTIEKVVYSFPNVTSCRNVTSCNLNLTFFSSEKVLLEIPLQDGVTSDDIQQMVLVSTCRPRLGVYFIFPVLILISILCCAFI